MKPLGQMEGVFRPKHVAGPQTHDNPMLEIIGDDPQHDYSAAAGLSAVDRHMDNMLQAQWESDVRDRGFQP